MLAQHPRNLYENRNKKHQNKEYINLITVVKFKNNEQNHNIN
jgi:hypothetical protein